MKNIWEKMLKITLWRTAFYIQFDLVVMWYAMANSNDFLLWFFAGELSVNIFVFIKKVKYRIQNSIGDEST